ncbi:hypothetical protein [Streptomyces echinatus]|uniref:hypothetical protein n=1 Tax=Streptomyces echinatus TaxID=67293 RepID=UPI003811BBF8
MSPKETDDATCPSLIRIEISDQRNPDTVEVNDSLGEHAGGLYVRWRAPELAEAARQAVIERQDPAAPEWKRHAEVIVLMQPALIGILRLAGFSAVRAEEIDDLAQGDAFVHADASSFS